MIERTNHGGIVAGRPEHLELGEPAVGVGFGRFLIEDGGVERVLVGKVLKDERLGDAGRGGDLPRRGAAEAVLGERRGAAASISWRRRSARLSRHVRVR